MDKHFSLLQKFVTFGRKKFYNIGPLWALLLFVNTRLVREIHYSDDEIFYLFLKL